MDIKELEGKSNVKGSGGGKSDATAGFPSANMIDEKGRPGAEDTQKPSNFED